MCVREKKRMLFDSFFLVAGPFYVFKYSLLFISRAYYEARGLSLHLFVTQFNSNVKYSTELLKLVNVQENSIRCPLQFMIYIVF